MMKNFLIALFLLGLMATAQAAHIAKVPAKFAHIHMQADFIETNLGQIISQDEISGDKTMKELLDSANIELKNGEVLYPEEVEFFHIKSAPTSKPAPFDTARAPRDYN